MVFDPGIEHPDLTLLIRGAVLTNHTTYFFQEGMHVLLGRCNQELPVVLTSFCPRKSKSFSICVTLDFSGERCKPRASRNGSTRVLTSFSSSSLELPVMMKSSA
jgi:hypothetical protein